MSLSSKFNNLNDSPVTEALAKWDGNITPEALERVQEVMNKDQLTTHRSDGKGRIRPSSIGANCSRPALLSYFGEASDPVAKSSRSIMDAGTWRHYYWQAVGLSAGFLNTIETPLTYEPWRLSGSADGVGDRVGVFEFKSTNSSTYNTVSGSSRTPPKPKRAHKIQVNAYMMALDLTEASLVYEDRNFCAFTEIRITRDDKLIEELQERFDVWNAHIEYGTLPPILDDCWQQTGTEFRYCGWKDSCFARG